jgi:hypothetical protein
MCIRVYSCVNISVYVCLLHCALQSVRVLHSGAGWHSSGSYLLRTPFNALLSGLVGFFLGAAAMPCPLLHCTILHCIALHYTALHFTALYYTVCMSIYIYVCKLALFVIVQRIYYLLFLFRFWDFIPAPFDRA